jgi:hypothetical protein
MEMAPSTRPWVSGLCFLRAAACASGSTAPRERNRARESLNERGLSVPLMLSGSYFRRSLPLAAPTELRPKDSGLVPRPPSAPGYSTPWCQRDRSTSFTYDKCMPGRTSIPRFNIDHSHRSHTLIKMGGFLYSRRRND